MNDTTPPPVNTPPWAARGREVILEEAAALQRLTERLGPEFDAAVEKIYQSTGRTVLTGMGKHGLIARKIAASLASTGTSCFFLHPAEALHGDLGMLQPSDIIIALSNSGSTQELVSCLPFFRTNGNPIIAMTGNASSPLAKAAEIILDIQVDREVCPLNLAPTTSTTAALAMGDALTVALLERRGFRPDDFALRHPNGALGRMFKTVADLMQPDSNPVVPDTVTFAEAIAAITAARHGAVSIVDARGALAGILTDGDLRRILQREAQTPERSVGEVFRLPVREIMTSNPLSVSPATLANQAVAIMEDGTRKVLVLPVIDDNRKPLGMIHLHDLMNA